MEIVIAVLAVMGLVVLALASIKWGTSSIEPFNSKEWQRRRDWRGFSHRA